MTEERPILKLKRPKPQRSGAESVRRLRPAAATGRAAKRTGGGAGAGEAERAKQAPPPARPTEELERALLAELRGVAPALWEPSRPVPLAVGIHEQIFPIAERLDISRRFVRRFLGRWTSTSEYLCALARPEAQRVNLDGSPAGEVDEQHRTRAERRLRHPSKAG